MATVEGQPPQSFRPIDGDSERLRLLERLAAKLLDSRLIDERERLVNELARQEVELCRYRSLVQEQGEKQEELHAVLRLQELSMLSLKDTLAATEQELVATKRAGELTLDALRKQLLEKELQLHQERQAHEATVARLRAEPGSAPARPAPTPAPAPASVPAPAPPVHSGSAIPNEF